MSDAQTVIIAAGGTGGHVFPALAVAGELKSRGVNVLWMGTDKGMESRLVPAHGFALRTLPVSALRGKGITARLAGVFNLFGAITKSLLLIRKEKPEAVLGMGGFVAGPVCVAAWLCRCRTVLHEQNAVAGMTNRIVKKFATKVLEAVPNTFSAGVGAVHTGNPVRKDILLLSSPAERMGDRKGPIRILVIGGSQGARALNEKVPLAAGLVDIDVQVRHQAGRGNVAPTVKAYGGSDVKAEVTEFIDDMAQAYSWADLIICRAGAMTIAEIAAVGLASVLVPYPFAVDDHQTANGSFLVEAKAAVMLQESELTEASLAEKILSLAADRSRLLEMANNARAVGKRDATDLVVGEILGEAA